MDNSLARYHILHMHREETAMFGKLKIDEEDESIVSNSSTDPVVQGSVLRDAIAYANKLGKSITLKMAGKEIVIAPCTDWYKLENDFFS